MGGRAAAMLACIHPTESQDAAEGNNQECVIYALMYALFYLC